MTHADPLARRKAVTRAAQVAARLQAATLSGDAEAAFGLCLQLITEDFDDLERHAIPGERELRRSLHEIIDTALRQLVLADGSSSSAWRRLALPDQYGLFECSMLASNARWLRLCGSSVVEAESEPLDLPALAKLPLKGQARRLLRFALSNDGATPLDYPALRAALDPRLLPFLHDWLATVHYLSPARISSTEAARNQNAAMQDLIAARRGDHRALPASSNQSGPAFRAPYFTDANTRELSVEFNGRQMSSLMQSFRPTPAECRELKSSLLDVRAIIELGERDSDELVICPNWHSEHVIYRCMSPLVAGMRDRGAPLLRVGSEGVGLPPVATDWASNTVDVVHNSAHALAHMCAINHALAANDLDFVFYPEIVPANSSSWMATERVARIQATGYGFPVTSGLSTIDFFVGGRDVERRGAEADYAEQLILLPGLGVSTTAPPPSSAARERSTDAPLDPADPLRVVTTTSHQKLTRPLLEAWNAILAENPGATLDLFTNMTPAQVDVHSAELARLLSSGRITLHTSQPRQVIIDTIAEADLYLDAFPYGGFNSLVEPLSVGCPVITLEGQRARNRLGAALVRRAGLPESTIAKSFADYIAISKRVLQDVGERKSLRAQLGSRREVLARLADPDLAAHMDAAIEVMRRRGPRRNRRQAPPLFIRAGEKPVLLPA